MLADGDFHQNDWGYRLVRRRPAAGQEHVVVLPFFGEFGFELFGFHHKANHVSRTLRSEGKYVTVTGQYNRHAIYQDCDEFIAVGRYNDGHGQNHRIDFAKALYPSARTIAIETSGPVYDELVSLGARRLDGSPVARLRAEQIAGGQPFIIIMPRLRAAEGSRNFHMWPSLVGEVKKLLPGVRIISTNLKSTSVNLEVEYLEDIVGSMDMLDVEMELQKLATCTVAPNSGCQCIPLLAGARNVVTLLGFSYLHKPLLDAVHANSGSITRIYEADNSCPTRHAQDIHIKVSEMISKNFKDWVEDARQRDSVI